MDKSKVRLAWFVAVLLAGALLLRYLTQDKPTPIEEAAPESSDFLSPYLYSSPGNYPGFIPAESIINVYVDNPAIAMLSGQYMPLFGFVGMTAV